MTTDTTGGASAPITSKLALAKAAQAEVQSEITAQRVALVTTMLEHKNIGGEDQTQESLLAIMEKFPEGLPYAFLQTVFPDAALTAAREELKKAKKIEQVGKKGKIVIKPVVTAVPLRPPRVRELAEALRLEPEEMEALLLRLERFGRLLRVAANRFFLPETVVTLGRLAHALAAESEDGGFTAADYNKRSGIGRNLTIEVLEYLDGLGVTRRAGDLRHGVKPAEEAAG